MAVMTPALQDALAKTLTGIPASWTGLYLALHTGDPGTNGIANEVTGGSYVAQLYGPSFTSNGTVVNSADINFPAMPAVTVTHVSVRTAQTGGTALLHGPLTTPIAVTAGQTLRVASGVGSFQITP